MSITLSDQLYTLKVRIWCLEDELKRIKHTYGSLPKCHQKKERELSMLRGQCRELKAKQLIME